MTWSASLRTRTTDNDYSWTGRPPQEWWRQGWGSSLLRKDRPCLLRDEGQRILLTGIQSQREDRVGTRIRYEVLLEPGTTADGLSKEHVDALIQEWWEQRYTGTRAPWPMGASLDAALKEQAGERSVDELLDTGQPDVSQALRAVVQSTATTTPAQAPVQRKPAWIGAEHPDVEKLLLSRFPVAYFVGVTLNMYTSGLGTPVNAVNILDATDGIEYPKSQAPVQGPGKDNKKVLTAALAAVATLAVALLVYRLLRRS